MVRVPQSSSTLVQLQLPTGQRSHGINFVLHPEPTNTCALVAGGKQEWLTLKLQAGCSSHPQEHTEPALQAASGSWNLWCSILGTPKDCCSWSSKESSESDLQKGPPLNHSASQTAHLKIIWTWQSGRVAPNIREAPSNTYFQLQIARLDPVRQLEQRQRRAHQRESLGSSKADTVGLCSLPAPACSPWPISNTWGFWELLPPLHLFSIYSKRVPISGRLLGSAGI